MATIISSHKTLTRWFFLLVGAAVLYVFWRVVEPFALILLTSAIVAIVLMPLMRWLEKHTKSPKLSAVIIIIGVLLGAVLPLTFGAIAIADDATEFLQSSFGESGFFRNFNLNAIPGVSFLPANIQKELGNIHLSEIGTAAAKWIADNATVFLASAANAFLSVFIFFIALFYLLVDREKIKEEVQTLSPFRNELDRDIITRMTGTVRNVVFGALIVSGIQGIMAAIGLTIFGVPGALLWGALTIIASQVPILGVGLILGPAVLYLLMSGNPGSALGLLIWSVMVVGLVDNILSPQLLKGRTNMHALLILISILGGLKLFGPIGFIAGPTILAAVMVLMELYKKGILDKDSIRKISTSKAKAR